MKLGAASPMGSTVETGLKVLVITNFYTPWLTPRAVRWTAICEHWAAQGFDVQVVAGAASGAASIEVLNGVSVHRVGSRIIERVRERLVPRQPGKRGIRDGSAVEPRRKGRPHPAVLLKALHDQTWKRIYWPDFACLWVWPALQKATELLVSNSDRKLVSVSLPFSGHLVGLRLKRRFPNLRWIADVGDPFALSDRTPHNNRRLYSALNYRAEARVLRDADAIAVTAPAALRAYAGAFPEVSTKLHEIPPLISSPKGHPSRVRLEEHRGSRRITYVGHLYSSIRTPDYLLRLFARLIETPGNTDLELHFFGDVSECARSFTPYERLVGRRIFLHGTRSRAEVFAAMFDSALLINIGNDTEYQLPSKVAEYASTGRPILNIIKSERDSSLAFLAAYPSALHLVDAPGEIAAEDVTRVQQLLSLPGPDWPDDRTAAWLERFSVERVAAQYEGLLGSE